MGRLRSDWTRRDTISAILPLGCLALIGFLFTDASASVGVVFNIHDGVLLGLFAMYSACEVHFFFRYGSGFESCRSELVFLAALGIQFLATGSVLLSLLFHFAPQEVHRREIPGRGSMALLERQFMYGRSVTLADLLCDAGPVRVYRPRAMNAMNWSSKRVVRPEGHGQGNGRQVQLGPDGIVVGFGQDSWCEMAWDPVSGRRWGRSGEPISALPIFRLVGRAEGVVEQDVRSLEEEAAARSRGRESVRDPGVDIDLRDALSHPNPAVRAAARRIVDAGGPEVYPEASKVPR